MRPISLCLRWWWRNDDDDDATESPTHVLVRADKNYQSLGRELMLAGAGDEDFHYVDTYNPEWVIE